MNLKKSVRYLMVALLIMTAGCGTDGEGLNSSGQAISGSVDDDTSEVGASDNDASIDTAVVSDETPASDAPSDLAGESGRLPALVDEQMSPSPDESGEERALILSYDLGTDEDRAVLVEGFDEGVSIVIEVAFDGDEQIELQIEPESLVDGQGIDIELDLQNLDSENNSATATFTMPVGMRPQRELQRTFNITATSNDIIETKPITLDIMPLNAPDVYLLIGQSNMVGSSEEDADCR